MLEELKDQYKIIGYEVTKMKTLDMGLGYYIKPIQDTDTVLNWMYVGNTLKDLEDNFNFTKENYPIL